MRVSRFVTGLLVWIVVLAGSALAKDSVEDRPVGLIQNCLMKPLVDAIGLWMHGLGPVG